MLPKMSDIKTSEEFNLGPGVVFLSEVDPSP